MRIQSVDVYIYKVPKIVDNQEYPLLNKGSDYFKHSERKAIYSKKQESVIVKITTECGQTGWGEALSPIAPEAAGEIIKRILTPLLLEQDPRDVEVLWNQMYDAMRERGFLSGFMLTAISAVDIALWDLWGKSLQLPVYKLLGGAERKLITAYVSGIETDYGSQLDEQAAQWKQKGFHAFKLHLGFGIQEDKYKSKLMRGAFGDNVTLMVDVHQRYTVSQAIQLGRHLETLNYEFLEAPVLCEDIHGIAETARALDIAVAIGEELRTRYEFKERLKARAGDIFQPDIGWVGISEMRKICNMSEAFNIPIAPHLSNGLGLSIAAALHLCSNIHNFYMLEYQPNVLPVANNMLVEPIVCEAGYYILPEGPGLGVNIREDVLMKSSVRL